MREWLLTLTNLWDFQRRSAYIPTVAIWTQRCSEGPEEEQKETETPLTKAGKKMCFLKRWKQVHCQGVSVRIVTERKLSVWADCHRKLWWINRSSKAFMSVCNVTTLDLWPHSRKFAISIMPTIYQWRHLLPAKHSSFILSIIHRAWLSR